MTMRNLFLLIILCAVSFGSVYLRAQTQNENYVAYIEKYKKEAQHQQKKHGIPASITLAQGLLESGAGKSELATKANNHFGVKCAGDWTGGTYHHDDETKGECFRSYKHAEESYEDHSLFLLRPRYKALFDLALTDYKGWAHGLKQCGYATDPGYATKLIKIIEDYDLARFVHEAVSGDVKKGKGAQKKTEGGSLPKAGAKASKKSSGKQPSAPKTTPAEEKKTELSAEEVASPVRSTVSMPPIEVNPAHEIIRNNGSRYIVARPGDTFASLAAEYNIYEKTLRRYNDIVNPRYELQAGDKVYLQPKRRRAARQYAVYRVRRDENIWQIAQDKGVRLKTIYRLNGIEEGQNVTINQELRLR